MAYRYPFSPFPDGWFFVCYSHELPRGRLFNKTFMGRDVIAFRGESGEVCVADAFCPHLGAHLAKGGGCIEGDAVRCPFHGFRFDHTGRCVSTPYGEPPKAARLKTWPVHELGGFVLAYHDAEGRAPDWRVQECDITGFGELHTRHYWLRGHPQETTENGVDPGHLSVVHGYRDVEPQGPMQIDGAHLTGRYKMRRSAGVLEFLNINLTNEFQVHVWGLGYSRVEVSVPQYGIEARQWIFSTPSDGEHVDLHIALRVKPIAHPERILPGLQRLPRALLSGMVERMIMKVFENDIEQDFEIWEHKGYVQRPALNREDGPIGLYRRYCRQFYPELRVKAPAAE
jgi:phenylpropionate dioxygenase-like ring-hydroxylating dioxygenase large terminal subunit